MDNIRNKLLDYYESYFLAEISFNKVKRGYVKGDKFDELIKQSL